MSQSNLSRRTFAGAALSTTLARAVPPGDRVALAVIGTGSRGQFHVRELGKLADRVAITAVCDVYRPNLERAAQLAARTWGAIPYQTADYREALARKDVDAVIIATPDFSHSRILEHAVEAGKDVYCEKPLGTVFAEAKAAYLAVNKTGRVVQIGTQRRSEGAYVAAAKLVRSGILGQITRIDVSVNFQEPRWRRDHSAVQPAEVAWEQFQMHLPRRPFDARRLREWQLFSDYANGIPGLWMSHFSDVVHWFMDELYPAGAVANGGVFLWKDGRETSDVFDALLDYPKGFLFSFAMSLTNAAGNRNLWHGTRGTLDMDALTVSGAGSKRPDRIQETSRIQPEKVTSHLEDFLDCVRTRAQPRADIQAGFSHAVAGIMASEALRTGRRTRFDPERLELS
jgi:predicted dehydrogenase